MPDTAKPYSPVTHEREGTYCFRCGHWLWPAEGCRQDRPSPAAAPAMLCEAERCQN